MANRLTGIINRYKIILILIIMLGFLVIFKLKDQNIDNNVVDMGKINGLTAEEIEELNIDEYNEFVSNLNDSDVDKIPTRYDISEYVSWETEDFIIESFDEENKVVKVKLINKDIDEAKQSFEKWYLENVSNKRSEINIVWSD